MQICCVSWGLLVSQKNIPQFWFWLGMHGTQIFRMSMSSLGSFSIFFRNSTVQWDGLHWSVSFWPKHAHLRPRHRATIGGAEPSRGLWTSSKKGSPKKSGSGDITAIRCWIEIINDSRSFSVFFGDLLKINQVIELFWLVFGTFFIFHNIWDNPSQLTNIFQRGWNHQPDRFVMICYDLFLCFCTLAI